MFSLTNCSSSSSSDGTTVIASENSGAIVAAVFSSSGQASVSQALINRLAQKVARTVEDAPTTCDSLDGGEAAVTISGQGEAGTYGADTDEVTIADADTEFCQDTDEVDVESDTDLFASFTVTDAAVTCDDDTSATMSGTGVFRQGPEVGYCPEIYGNFTITTADGEAEANCTIRISCEVDGLVEDATCSDGDGNSITLSEEVACEIDAG